MTHPENNANRAVVLYKGSPLERVDTRSLVFPETQQQEPRFFLPEDIVVGRYRVTGFLMIDNRPEKRWVSYTNSEWIGVEVHEPDMFFKGSTNSSHFFNADRGFKMIRYFVLPPDVAKFFDQDRFLGGPMIDKCCRDETLPDEFDEELADPNYAFGSERFSTGVEEIIESAVKASFPELTPDEQKSYGWGRNQHAYVSFHPWQDFKFVIQEGQNSIFAAIKNFDDVLSRFDRNQILSEKDLQVTASDIPQIQTEG